MKSKTKKILLSIFTSIILVIILAFVYFYSIIRSSLPITAGEIEISGTQQPVEITFDKMGIPQVWAQNETDAWFAIGWLHANDRLFQMELTRRVSQGRLSEMFGDITLEFDRTQRKIGHHRMAKSDLKNLPDDVQIYLQAYSDGINAWANSVSNLPFEYILLGLDFEAWKIEDCLSILSFQTWFSDALQNNDELFYFVANKFGEESARKLFFNYPEWGEKTVPQPDSQSEEIPDTPRITGIDIFKNSSSIFSSANPVDKFKESILNSIFNQNKFPSRMAHSSNCWVASPVRSKNGHTILASDPHLELTRLPQFWYYIGVHTSDNSLNVLGITAPGLPVIVMGHNGQAAWAFTAGGVDVTDQYSETINPENKNQYQSANGWKNFETVEEIIFSSNSDEPETLQVRFSNHGPVMMENDSLGVVYSLKWAGFDKSLAKAAKAGFALAKISTFNQFRENVTNFGALDANWMYADKNGNIGYQLGTPIPIRKDYNNNLRHQESQNELEWQGYYPIEKTPHTYNPQQGWLASSNNKPDEENLEYNLYGNFAYDRIMRISQLMESKRILTATDFQTFQMDTKSNYLLRWQKEAAGILRFLSKNELADQIENWDGSGNVGSREMAIMETWIHLFRKYTFEDELGKLYSKLKFVVLEKGGLPEDSPWYDDTRTAKKIETRLDIIQLAMQDALKISEGKNWGEIQSLTIAHPLAQIPILSGLLGLEKGPFPRGGSAGTLNSSFNYIKDNKFKCIVGPSWRFIIDFADVDGATIVLPAGQSGHPLSSHFFDFYSLWTKGERWNVPFSKNTVYDQKISLVRLKPANEK